MNLGDVFSYPARFALRIFWFGFIALIAITFIRIGYCVAVANTSLSVTLPQIARYVAEYNGLPINPDAEASTIEVCRVMSEENLVREYDNTGTEIVRVNKAFEYRIDGNWASDGTIGYTNLEDIKWALESNAGKESNNSLKVYLANDHSHSLWSDQPGAQHQLAQKGQVITVELTVWATLFSPVKLFGHEILPAQFIPITRTMNVPAVKYYRGLP